MFLGEKNVFLEKKKTRVFRRKNKKNVCFQKKTTKNLNGKSETRNEPKIAEIRESGICEKLRSSQPGFPEKLRN